jgi:hypothetical protein
MNELPPETKLPVDLPSEDAKKFLVSLQQVLKPCCLAVGNIDPEKNHCREIFVKDSVPMGALRPRFNFDYLLKDMGKYTAMSWKDTTLSYEEAMLFYAITFMVKPLTVVETGMGLGLSTVHIAQALIDNQKGELFTFEQDSGLIQRGVSALNSYGFKEQVTVISQSSVRVLSEWVRPVDLAFLDTPDKQVEFNLLLGKMKPGGIIVSRGPLSVPNDGLWRKMEFPGMETLWLYQRVQGVGAVPTGAVVPEFRPEQVDWMNHNEAPSVAAAAAAAVAAIPPIPAASMAEPEAKPTPANAKLAALAKVVTPQRRPGSKAKR